MRRALPEIVSCGFLDTEPAMPEVNLIEVAFEYLLLGVVLPHFDRGGLLAQFSRGRHVGAIDSVGVHVADELLRNRARTAEVTLHRVFQRARNAHDVDAVMLVEALIFDSDERFTEVFGERSQGNADAPLLADFTEQRP